MLTLRRYRGFLLLILVLCPVCVLYIARRPQSRMMQVARVYGDIYRPSLQPQPWDEGATEKCVLASRTLPTPNNADDLLLCGNIAVQAWNLVWLREDVRKSLYANSVRRQVNFHTAGHGGGRNTSPWWACEKRSSTLIPTLECH